MDGGSRPSRNHSKRKAQNLMSIEQPTSSGPGASERDTRMWAMILHLSVFAGYVIPLAGLVAPIVIWQVKKAEMPVLDVHGKIVANWIISALIYGVAGFLLSFLLIGIPLLIALGLACLIFPIVGGIKANNGEIWKYPLSIQFLK